MAGGRYMNISKSQKLYSQALQFMPGGVNSPVRAFKNVGKTPLFIEKAKGSRIYDADGNEYIDYVCSWGPNILGHAYPEVIEAVKKSCDKGLTFGACHKGEVELAQIIQKNIPSMEMLRLVNSGTEAVMSAVRAARGFTGRDKIVKFEGCYHGHSDGLLVKAGSGLLTNSIPDSAGVPEGFTENTLLAKYNNIDSVAELFEKYGSDIACVIVEPCAANMGVIPPKKGFLKFLRDITCQYNSLLFLLLINKFCFRQPHNRKYQIRRAVVAVTVGGIRYCFDGQFVFAGDDSVRQVEAIGG